MDIEQVSETQPEKILKIPIHPHRAFEGWQAWELANFLGFKDKAKVKSLGELCEKLYKLFMEKDANLLEINPLVQTAEDEFIALDAKMSFDENALYRQPDLKSIYEGQKRDKSEAIAREHGLSYIQLDGEIACMVNGAGFGYEHNGYYQALRG